MASPSWNYPVLLAAIGSGQRPGQSALRRLVRRMRHEAFPAIADPALRRRQVRRVIQALVAR